jgi:CDP-diglyceride synthetase
VNSAHKHIEELIGAILGTGSGLVVVGLTNPQIEFLIAVGTAFACGVAGALGTYIFKRFTNKPKKPNV